MKKIAIIGAGGFGREVAWLIERINEDKNEWNFIWYYDDIKSKSDDNYPVLGNVDDLLSLKEKLYVVCAIGTSSIRKKVLQRLTTNCNIEFPNLIDPTVIMSDSIKMGVGNIICSRNIFTVNVSMGDHNIVNLNCTIGHDVIIESYITLNPTVNISGNVILKEACEFGTGSEIIQGITVGENTIVGAGAVVVRDLPSNSVCVGMPAKPIKFF